MKYIFIVLFLTASISYSVSEKIDPKPTCVNAGYVIKKSGFFGIENNKDNNVKAENPIVEFVAPGKEHNSVHKYDVQILDFKFILIGQDWHYIKDAQRPQKAFANGNNIIVSKKKPRLVVSKSSLNSLIISRQGDGSIYDTSLQITFTKDGPHTIFIPSEAVTGQQNPQSKFENISYCPKESSPLNPPTSNQKAKPTNTGQ